MQQLIQFIYFTTAVGLHLQHWFHSTTAVKAEVRAIRTLYPQMIYCKDANIQYLQESDISDVLNFDHPGPPDYGGKEKSPAGYRANSVAMEPYEWEPVWPNVDLTTLTNSSAFMDTSTRTTA